MSLITPATLRELNVEIKKKYEGGLAANKPEWKVEDLATMDKTAQGETLIHWMDRSPLVRDWTGISKEITNISERGLRVPMRDLELTAGLQLKELERGNARMLRISLQYVSGGAARYKHDLLMSALINGGISVSPLHPKPVTYVGFDGQPLFGDHPINPDQPMTAKVTAPLTNVKIDNKQTNVIGSNPMGPGGIQAAKQRARMFRDPRVVNLGVELDTYIVHPTLKEATLEAIGAKIIATFPTATSGASKENVNATISMLSDGQMVIDWPELDDGTAASQTTWYGLCRRHRSGAKPFEILIEKEMVFGTNLGQVAALMETQGILEEKVLFAASGRATAYASLWPLFVKNQVAAYP